MNEDGNEVVELCDDKGIVYIVDGICGEEFVLPWGQVEGGVLLSVCALVLFDVGGIREFGEQVEDTDTAPTYGWGRLFVGRGTV